MACQCSCMAHVRKIGTAACAHCSCSCAQVLRKPGRAVALAVGGAKESLLSRPHTLDLVLKKRQGFIRIALQTGTTAHHALKWLTSWADSAHMRSSILQVEMSLGFQRLHFPLTMMRKGKVSYADSPGMLLYSQVMQVQCICFTVVIR